MIHEEFLLELSTRGVFGTRWWDLTDNQKAAHIAGLQRTLTKFREDVAEVIGASIETPADSVSKKDCYICAKPFIMPKGVITCTECDLNRRQDALERKVKYV